MQVNTWLSGLDEVFERGPTHPRPPRTEAGQAPRVVLHGVMGAAGLVTALARRGWLSSARQRRSSCWPARSSAWAGWRSRNTVIVFVPATIALLLQDQIAALVFGGTAAPIAAPAGLSVGLLLAFGVFFVLGFALYAVLYAGAASLVSRTEDINQIVAPMTLVSMGGYLVAVYASTGLLDPNSTFVVALSFIPFFSPYLMLTRMSAGVAGPLDVVIAIVLLAVTLPLVLWVAARFYAAGVLMYGQRPGLRLMLRVLRGAR